MSAAGSHTILHFSSPTADLRMNVEAITDSIGVLSDVLKKEKPHKPALKTSDKSVYVS